MAIKGFSSSVFGNNGVLFRYSSKQSTAGSIPIFISPIFFVLNLYFSTKLFQYFSEKESRKTIASALLKILNKAPLKKDLKNGPTPQPATKVFLFSFLAFLNAYSSIKIGEICIKGPPPISNKSHCFIALSKALLSFELKMLVLSGFPINFS